MRRYAVALALVVAGMTQVIGGAPGPASASGACPAEWAVVATPARTPPGGNYLWSVASAGTDDVWAVGEAAPDVRSTGSDTTLTEHWNGSSWQKVASPNAPSENRLLGVSAVSGADVWAVGFSGDTTANKVPLIEHWNGSAWSIVTAAAPPNPGGLEGVFALSASSVWAVGSQASSTDSALIEHWNGSAWSLSSDAAPASAQLTSVWASSDQDVWAVGSNENPPGTVGPFAEHWNGSAWSVATPSHVSNDRPLEGVSGTGPGDVWAVGAGNSGTAYDFPVGQHWNGSAWTRVVMPGAGSNPNGGLNGVASVAANDVWAVGDFQEGNSNDDTRTLAEHWDGAHWNVSPTPSPTTLFTGLHAIAIGTGGERWAVGGDQLDSFAMRRCDVPGVAPATTSSTASTVPPSTTSTTPNGPATPIPPTGPVGTLRVTTGPGAGGGPDVRSFDVRGTQTNRLNGFDPGFTGGVSVAVGPVEGTYPNDITVGAGPGGAPTVRILRSDGSLVRQFNAYDPNFHGGVRVAVADLDKDGKGDIVTAPGPGGGPNVKVWKSDGTLLASFFAYDPGFAGGVSVAASGWSSDPFIATGAGPGGGPDVRTFNVFGQQQGEFFAYSGAFAGGVSVGAGLLNGQRVVVAGPGPGGGPNVKVFGGTGSPMSSFFAYDGGFGGGVYVAAANDDYQSGALVLVTGAGPGGGPDVRTFDINGRGQTEFFAYGANFGGGVHVAAGHA